MLTHYPIHARRDEFRNDLHENGINLCDETKRKSKQIQK